jgi:hypothetical protein
LFFGDKTDGGCDKSVRAKQFEACRDREEDKADQLESRQSPMLVSLDRDGGGGDADELGRAKALKQVP